jgi:dienelactone hydrolase
LSHPLTNFQQKRFKLLRAAVLLTVFSFASSIQVAVAAHLPLGLETTAISAPEPETFKVKVETGTRCTNSGTMQGYTLYIPETGASGGQGPFPTVVLIHGFLMTGEQHKNNAQYLAEHGFIVLTPNISKWLWGDDKRTRNVSDLVDALGWLTGKKGDQPNSIRGLVDTSRVGVAGNSSGGAAALELVLQAQQANIPIHALVSLDGVPWDRTYDRVHDIRPLKLLTLRAEPCLCNYHARILKFLSELSFPYEDVKVNGSHHCDVENPTTLGCYSVCGKSDNGHRVKFQYLLYLFFRDALEAPKIGTWQKSFSDVVADMQSGNEVVRETNNFADRSEISDVPRVSQ